MKKFNFAKGISGENTAAEFLVENGFNILAHNYKSVCGEIDIIAIQNGTLVFIEVKSRLSEKYGNPSEAVDKRKQGRIARAAINYIKQTSLYNMPVRFDVVEITGGKINLIKNAFSSDIWY